MMTATECPAKNQIQALTLGQLPEYESEELFEHIRGCERCKSELAAVEDTEDSLISSLRDTDEPAGFEDEADCKVAVLKALGAFALAGNADETSDFSSLPERIGEYEILRPIGRGGMGIVLLARHTKLGRDVALKLLSSSRLANSHMRLRFEAEIKAVGRLNHPHIVTAHDAREVDGMAVLVTEYIDGFDLGELTSRCGPLSIADACEIARCVAVALEYTHRQGFVHRDVKPSNIMLSQDGQTKLLDLGLARLQCSVQEQSELTAAGGAMGTADYIAPEQVSDSRSVDIGADIYALGCTLFKLLTGAAPFADKQHVTAFAKMQAHVATPPPNLASFVSPVPLELVRLIESMLAKEPAQRPQTPQEVADKLSQFCNGNDLPALARRAAASEARSESIDNRVEAKNTSQSASFWARRVPFSTVIGAGLLGVMAGICLSIVIIITNPDGTQSILRLAKGSSVKIVEEDSGSSTSTYLASAPEPKAQASEDDMEGLPPGQPIPLSFAVLVNRDSHNRTPSAADAEIVAATEELQRSSGTGAPIRTEIGTWYPMAEDLAVPVKAFNGGVPYALVSHRERIGWKDIRGHVIGANAMPNLVTAFLDDDLGEKIKRLTGQNIRNQLAIIANDRIRSAPYINAEIGKQVMINGKFETGETKQLMEWLAGGLVFPLPNTPSSNRRDNDSKTNRAKPVEADTDEARSDLTPPGRPQDNENAKQPRLRATQRNLQRIGQAFLDYHEEYGKFPGTRMLISKHDPGALPGGGRDFERGQYGVGRYGAQKYPFSWRVAILPFVGETELFQQYRFDKPWDSEHNQKLLDKMPSVFRSPFAPSGQARGFTNYFGFANEKSALGLASGHSKREFTDGLSGTLLVMEAKCAIEWTNPRDIPLPGNQLSAMDPVVLFEDHDLQFVTADGAVRSFPPSAIDIVDNMITRNGGEIPAGPLPSTVIPSLPGDRSGPAQ